MIDKQYKDLMKHCQLHMEQVEKNLPEPKEDLQRTIKRARLQPKRFR